MANEKKNVYQRIAAVMEEAKYVQKTGYNAFHKYKYAKESDYIETLRPVLLKHGLVVTSSITEVAHEGELTQIKMLFRVVNIDDPTDAVEYGAAGQGADKGDKGVYKAITGAKKYFLGLAFLIETGDDPEEDEETDRRASGAQAPAKPSNVVNMPAQAPAAPAASAPAARPAASGGAFKPGKPMGAARPAAAPAPKPATRSGDDF